MIICLPLLAEAQGLVPCGEKAAPGGGFTGGCTLRHLLELAVSAINLMIQLSGMVAVIRIIMGGNHMMDGSVYGNPESYEDGKKTILHAILGLGFVFMAYAFVNSIWGLFFPEFTQDFGGTWFKPWN